MIQQNLRIFHEFCGHKISGWLAVTDITISEIYLRNKKKTTDGNIIFVNLNDGLMKYLIEYL